MQRLDSLYKGAMVRFFFEFEQFFHLLLYGVLGLSAMILIIMSFEAWGILYASIITISSVISTGIFWKLQSHFIRSLRSSLLLCLLGLLAYPTWVFAGSITHETPNYLLMVPVVCGIFALLVGSLFAWFSWLKVGFVGECGLLTKDIAKLAVNLPANFQTQNALNAFGSMARLSWLYANNEYSLVVSAVGSSIETLLRDIYPNKNEKVCKMVKNLNLDVYFKPSKYTGKPFTVTYFWHNVRSKYAHLTGVEQIEVKNFYIINLLREPSEETAMMSIGLLGVFLKGYSDFIQNQNQPYLEN